ncbi:MAG: oligopeptide transport system permease protein, partial [Lentimonas sp.]
MTKQQREQRSEAGRSLGQDAWERLRANRMAQIGSILFIGIILLCIIVPFFSSQSYETTRLSYGAQAPSWEHLFGTDDLGRDLFIRTLIGGRISIGVGFAAT